MSRKISTEASKAFQSNTYFKKSNTEVSVNGNLYLHGNLIARKETLGLGSLGTTTIFISLAGWNTPTTRERLNAIPGVRVHTKKGQAYLNGNPIDNNTFYPIDNNTFYPIG